MARTTSAHKGIAIHYLVAFILIALGAIVLIFIVLGGSNRIFNAVDEMLLWINDFFNW